MGSVAAAMRLAGAPNFRDLGGYETALGQRVRPGRIFRSDHLGHLTQDDLRLLNLQLGPVVRVLDFRGVNERQSAPCRIPGAQVHSLSIEPTIVQKLTELLTAGQSLSADDTVALMQDTYRAFVRAHTHRFAELFAHVLADDDSPIVFHCTAGKDRTGVAAALLLHALEVPEPLIWHDYLLTNERLARRAPPPGVPEPVAHVLHRVQSEFLQAAWAVITHENGGLHHYLREGVGLTAADLQRLRQRYLQDA